jgi:hypothetical protein
MEEDGTIPQTPNGNASMDEFGTPQESHNKIPWTDCAGPAPTTPTDPPLAKVLFDNPSGATTEGTCQISGPTDLVGTPPMNRYQPKPATSPHAIDK